MKKRILLTLGLISLVSQAQKTIIEEKFTNDAKPIEFQILEGNKLLVEKGKFYGTIRGINKVELYSLEDSNRQILVDEARLSSFRSSTIDNSFLGTEFTSVGWESDTKLYDGNKLVATIDKTQPKRFFSKDFTYVVSSKKRKFHLLLEEEDVYLHKYSIKDKTINPIQLEKPAFLKINKKDYFDLKKISHKIFHQGETFDITSKFINKDEKSFVLHRSIYDLEGKTVNHLSYEGNIGRKLLCSRNYGGEIDRRQYNTGMGDKTYWEEYFPDQLSINNYFLDKKTGDVYIYGVCESINGTIAYYVTKYDPKGNKIWQTLYDMPKTVFGDKTSFSLLKLNVGLQITNNTIEFSMLTDAPEKISVNSSDLLCFYSVLDQNTGSILKSNRIPIDIDRLGEIEYQKTQVVSFYTLEEFKKLKFDFSTLIYLDQKENENFKKYISNLNLSSSAKSKISLNTFVSDKGLWLVESDNDAYYKVSFFEI